MKSIGSLALGLDYTDAYLGRITLLDYIAGSETTRVTRSPKEVPERVITVEFEGWAMPRSGVGFVWRMRKLDRT